MSFCLYHGIMELWNDGIVGFERTLFILNFIIKMNFLIYPILQYPKTHFPNVPAFHHSNWGEALNLCYSSRPGSAEPIDPFPLYIRSGRANNNQEFIHQLSLL